MVARNREDWDVLEDTWGLRDTIPELARLKMEDKASYNNLMKLVNHPDADQNPNIALLKNKLKEHFGDDWRTRFAEVYYIKYRFWENIFHNRLRKDDA